MLSNKKAEGVHIGVVSIYMIIFAFLLVVMVFVLVIITDKYSESFMAYDPDIPKHIFAYRAINTCLAYQDSITGRFYPGIIDFTKYNQETLDKCYVDTDVKSFNIQLRDLDRIREYDRILVGFGASMSIKHYPVVIKYADGTTSQGELLFGAS